MFRRWLLAPVLRDIAALRHLTIGGFAIMSKEMDDLVQAEAELADEITVALDEIQTLAEQLKGGPSPSAIEDVAQKLSAQTARLKAALATVSAPAPAPVVAEPVAIEPVKPAPEMPAVVKEDEAEAPAV